MRDTRPIVTAIFDEPEETSKFNIIDVSVEKQHTDPQTWKMHLVDAEGLTYEYDLFFK